ncbi:ABC transporter ATP-binding protein [Domibacillus sp. DTU_2020_1001157_1_SI_ALB_TIR_016]|uniref:ABC transporter ATP-binding protein n=1 Tax=Domibacillus sp. DTU_2020_1001157_1_SI_ALB_TIR_016 TaxID=3077789 RepID=UPI0028EE21AE|nr:ABC transporter ATP-binding protein [Domibacillus sp. DTU_2020_1001157_1_SI_ALB_TIR_016]WNS78341.1 ABC transporter ATP-binding protein [Domibacillus sp. DTU_2020_1001157_1_SI_ALB_TIR_016]
MATSTVLPFEQEQYEQGQHKKIIQVKDLTLQYSPKQAPILQDIQLNLYENEFVCVLGPSGCGKSSLLNIIAGFQKTSLGSVFLNGKPYTRPNANIGVVFQHHNLFPWMTIKDNVGFGLKMKGLPKEKREKLVSYYLHLVDLQTSGDLLPHQLSGGMKQRAAIARTLAADPKAVLMDEPFSALDALTREKMQHHLLSIWQKTKKSIFFITHDVDEALLLGTRILVMQPNPGRITIDFQNPLKRNAKNPVDFKTEEFQELRTYLINSIKKS